MVERQLKSDHTRRDRVPYLDAIEALPADAKAVLGDIVALMSPLSNDRELLQELKHVIQFFARRLTR